MYHTYRHLTDFRVTPHLFIVSFMVFAVVNMIENLVHYSIGRDTRRESLTVKLKLPSKYDMLRIIVVMVIFGLMQALFTCYFTSC